MSKDTLFQGTLGPLNIFPEFFFHHELNRAWKSLQLCERSLQSKDKKEYIRNLLKSPLPYLNTQDGKVLYFLKIRETYRLSTNYDLEKEEREDQVLKSLWELKKIKVHLEQNKVDEAFLKLSQIFETFFQALTEEGEKSRKLMGLTEFFIDEFEDIQDHPYLHLLKVLTFVGRGKWVSATKCLHDFSESFPHPGTTKILIKMYQKIGMPQVAHYLKEQAKTEAKGQLITKAA